MFIPIFILIFCLNQSEISRNIDFTENIKFAENVLSNPDTLGGMVKDTSIFYSKSSTLLNSKKILTERIDYIKEYFNDKRLILINNLSYHSIMGDNDSILGYLMLLSYKNIENNFGLDFSFIEISPNNWKIYSISPFDPNDWPNGYRRE